MRGKSRAWNRTCSAACRVARFARLAARGRRPRQTTCDFCGTPFPAPRRVKPDHITGGPTTGPSGVYCTMQCYFNHRRSLMRTIEYRCTQCDTPFVVPARQRRAGPNAFCSTSCAGKYNGKTRTPEGRARLRARYEARRQERQARLSALAEAARRLTCPTCGAEYQHVPGASWSACYCSAACWRAAVEFTCVLCDQRTVRLRGATLFCPRCYAAVVKNYPYLRDLPPDPSQFTDQEQELVATARALRQLRRLMDQTNKGDVACPPQPS